MWVDASMIALLFLWSLLFAGAWVEVALLRIFAQWYFGWGPVVFRCASDGPHGIGAEELAALGKYFAIRQAGQGLLLLRRLTFPRFLDVPQLYASRLRVVVLDKRTVVEVRHPVCWPLILILPIFLIAAWSCIWLRPGQLLAAMPFLLASLLLITPSVLLARRHGRWVAALLGLGQSSFQISQDSHS